MRSIIRDAAAAFTSGAVLALVFDALLQLLTSWIRITGGVRPPWWVRTAEGSVWVALGLVLWLAAPVIAEAADRALPRAHLPRRTVWELVGLGLLALPLGHVIGQWIVLALQLTVADTWLSEGRIFLSGAYYGQVLLSVTPWLAAGAILRAWAQHMIPE